MQKTIIVTGANRGIGLEVVRQLSDKGNYLILTCRDMEKGRKAASTLNSDHISVMKLDLSNEDSITQFSQDLAASFDAIDVLVNNAGIYEGGAASSTAMKTVRQSLEVNTLGPWLLTQKLLSLLKKSKDPRIINVSSGSGQIGSMHSSVSAYRISKLALNGLTLMLADEFPKISVNSMCPGWVRTDMGGSGAPRTVEQGADTIVWLSTMKNPPSGKMFRDRKEIPW